MLMIHVPGENFVSLGNDYIEVDSMFKTGDLGLQHVWQSILCYSLAMVNIINRL